MSARDVNITTRGATSTLSTSQLALVDGRSVYLDFFGMVMWDLVPDQSGRDQADRGHSRSGVGRLGRQRHDRRRQRASPGRRARWPCRAGTSLTIGVGIRSTATSTGRDKDSGSLFYVNGVARARRSTIAGRTSCRRRLLHAGSAAASGRHDCRTCFNTPYPSFTNEGTKQPKFDGRVDYDIASNGGTVTVAGGVAGTQGLIHTAASARSTSRATRG